MKRFLLPLILFVALVFFLARGLSLDPHEVPSPLIGKPAPAFSLSRLDDPARIITNADMRGKVWLLNVWASWCSACRVEHPYLLELAKRQLVPMIGLNYKDQRQDGLDTLKTLGDPYQMSLFDGDGRAGIDFGVYGVPETFVIDKKGTIRLKHTGPVTPDVIAKRLQPLIEELNRE